MLRYRCFAARMVSVLAAIALAAALIPICAYAASADGSVDLPLDSDESTLTIPEQDPETAEGGAEDGEAEGDRADQAQTEPSDTSEPEPGSMEAIGETALNITIPLTVELEGNGAKTLKLTDPVPAQLAGTSSFINNSKSTVYISAVECFSNNINTVFTGVPTWNMSEADAEGAIIDVANDVADPLEPGEVPEPSAADPAEAAAQAAAQQSTSEFTWSSQNNQTGEIYSGDPASPRFRMGIDQQIGVIWTLDLSGCQYNLEQLAKQGLSTANELVGLKWTFSRIEG